MRVAPSQEGVGDISRENLGENWNKERRAMYVHAELWTGWFCRVRVWFHFSSCSLSSSILRRMAKPRGVIEMALRPWRSLISMKPWDCSN
jgi:hypothetical protein